MHVVMTLLVRDEIDIIESMLEFHFAQGLDKIIVTDNGSVDGTYEILLDYQKTGKIDLLREPPSDFSQHRWVSRMANMAFTEYHADWILHADADELFVPTEPGNIVKFFESIDDTVSVLKLPRHDFIPFDRPMASSPVAEMLYRKTVSQNLRGHPLPPKVAHRGSENVVITQGNHSVAGNFEGSTIAVDCLQVYHYPLRSYDQFESKVRNGGSGYQNNSELKPGIGSHKRYWYDLLLNGKLKEHYLAEHFYDDTKLAKSLNENVLVKDTKASNFFSSGTGI